MEESNGSQEMINFRSEILKLNNGNSSMKSNEEGEPPPELITTQYINIHRVSDTLGKEYVDCDAAASAGLINSELIQHHMSHSGMVVDMMVSQAPTDYSQHSLERTSLPQYIPEHYDTTEDLLPHDLTEEDRGLAAALVAVQLSQQQKLQHNHHSIVTSESNVIVSPGGTHRLLGSVSHVVNKVSEHHQMTALSSLSPVSVDKPAMSAMVSSYIQAVEEETAAAQAANNIHLVPVRAEHHHGERIMKMYQPQPQHLQMRLPSLPALKKVPSNHSVGIRNQYLRSHMNGVIGQETEGMIEIEDTLHHQVLMVDDGEHDMQAQDDIIKDDVHYVVKNEGLGLYYEESQDTPQNKNDSDYDVESDMRSSKRSLPHKKRIPRKLKNIKCPPLPTRISAKTYKCTKCGEQFDSPSLLAAHRLTHNAAKKLPFSCEICGKGFPHQLKFFEHLKSHYEPLMTIDIDAESSRSMKPVKETPLILEPKQETKGFTLSCSQCGKTFKRQKTFEAHMNLAHPKQEEMEEFSEPEDLMEGIREVVEVGGVETGDEGDMDMMSSPSQDVKSGHDVKSWYPDDELHAAEADIQELEEQHQQQQQQERQAADNMCDFCGQVFEDKDHVDLHIHEVHYEFKEEICKDENESPLPKSRRGSTSVKRPRKGGPHLSCPQCGRLFNHRNSLVYHLRSHSGERPHQCEVCGKSFFAASALKVHMRLHSGDKPYKCEFCGRHFRQWGDLKYHCISIHSEEKNYQCEYCGKDFARKYSLIVHRRIHTGEKNYKCEFCDKSFRASSYLQNHRRIHTGEKPHPCEVCGKPFRVRSDMKRHLNTHNRDRDRSRGGGGHHAIADVDLMGDAQPKLEDQDTDQLHGSLLDQHSMSDQNSVHEITIQMDGSGSDSLLPDEGDREPINLNIAVPGIGTRQSQLQQLSASTQVSEEVLHYSRDPLEMVREGGNTVYVWPVYMA